MRYRGLISVAVAAMAALALFPAAPATAGERSAFVSRDDLFDKRYCELIALRPDAAGITATVYNTFGLNDCPPPWWDSLTPEQASLELGAVYTVKNGPRHWIFDGVTVPELGPIVTVAGEQLRNVATITLTGSPLAVLQEPYVERTINRENTWRWHRGRRVYELHSPDGRVYVMQSYAKIVDPDMDRSDLRTLGSRLSLPDGWTFTTRRLRKRLVLKANGTATIVQDDLKNTYQRLR